MTGACSLCGRVGPVHAHHVTGRPRPGGGYLDGALTIIVCTTCHLGRGGLHQSLRTIGVEFVAPSEDLLAHRLRRVAVHAELIAAGDRPFVVAPRAARALAAILHDGAGALAFGRRAEEGLA
jgi:hypothetical protein